MRALALPRARPVAVGLLLLLGVGLVLFDVWRWWSWRHPEDRGDYAGADWAVPRRGLGHLSCYAFRDRDHDGRYGLGDEPMAGMAIEMTAPSGARAIVRSNLTGFVNFDMSRFARRAHIRRAGRYEFRALVPPGWILTSGSPVQRSRVEELLGAPMDLVSPDPPRPFGFAPVLSLTGRCLALGRDGTLAAAPETVVVAAGPGGRRDTVRVGADGGFRLAAVPGPWRLTFVRPGLPAFEREIEVRDAPVHLAGLVLGDQRPAHAGSPVVVDFESIAGSMVRKVPSGVAGLDWDYLNAIEVVGSGGEGYANTLSSGRYVGYSSSGHPVTISREGGFDLRGAYVGGAHRSAEGEMLRVRAFRGDRLVADDEVPLSALGPVWLDADYRAVDRVVLSTRHYWQFAIDDLVVSARTDAGGPAPAAGNAE